MKCPAIPEEKISEHTCPETYCPPNDVNQSGFTIAVCSAYNNNGKMTAGCIAPSQDACKFTCNQLLEQDQKILSVNSVVDITKKSSKTYMHAGCVPGNRTELTATNHFALAGSTTSPSNSLYPSLLLPLFLIMVLLFKAKA